MKIARLAGYFLSRSLEFIKAINRYSASTDSKNKVPIRLLSEQLMAPSIICKNVAVFGFGNGYYGKMDHKYSLVDYFLTNGLTFYGAQERS